ncbi:MAG: hypothetical protein GQ565_06285 [Candidatus Aegiribacteria sp.]|nr:hypothetical protein [Candidatus Aegiribacteria sp.]
MANKYKFPDNLESLKSVVLKSIDPIKPISDRTVADDNFLFSAQETKAGNSLPEFYLCYFLLVDLLGFKNIGQSEKISWSVPIDYMGIAFLIEHRKMGLGVFAHDAKTQEKDTEEIVSRIRNAVKLARPYFEWRAQEAAKQSELNVINHSRSLYNRYEFFQSEYRRVMQEVEKETDHLIRNEHGRDILLPIWVNKLKRNAEWLALAALDSFFSWTEHIFIHLAILRGRTITGEEVADLAHQNWSEKYKAAIDIKSKEGKEWHDQLVIIRRQLRNYITHGAFGKTGEAFSFHSGAGAVPMQMYNQKGKGRFSFYKDLGFDEQEIIELLQKFIKYLWSKEREPGRVYVESDLPLILPMAKDGTYRRKMKSVKSMKEFVMNLSWQFTNAGNMDF